MGCGPRVGPCFYDAHRIMLPELTQDRTSGARTAPGALEAFQIICEKRAALTVASELARPVRMQVQSIAYRCLMENSQNQLCILLDTSNYFK